MTKVLLVGAGAGYSTKDLEMGYYEAFQELGIDLSYYMLDRRLYIARNWLLYNWKHFLNSDPERKPTWEGVIYRGGVEALEMALRFDVDLVLAISAMYLHPDVLIMMRRAGLHTGVILTESPYMDERQASVAKLVDLCFTNERLSVPFLREFNSNTHYLRHAFSPVRHNPTVETGSSTITTLNEWQLTKNKSETIEVKSHDVVFVGTGFRERIDTLSGVDWESLGADLGLYGNWALLPSRHKLRKYVHGGIMTNMNAHELYRHAKIGLNLYRTSKEYDWNPEYVLAAESMNPRAYELAASGIFSLTQPRREANETLGVTQPCFNDASVLQDQLRYSLSHESWRAGNAELAQEHIQGHTFLTRAKEVLERAID